MSLAETYERGLAAHRAGRLAEAEAAYREVVARVEHPPSLHNLGVIFDQTGRVAEAGGWYRRAAAAAPDSAQRQFALGVHLRTIRDHAGAEAAYRQALALDPDHPQAAFDLGCVLLAQGRLAQAWPLYETRAARRKAAARFAAPEWDGGPLAGRRLLVAAEQGAGDQMLAARFLPRIVGSAGGQAIYFGPRSLRRLFEPLGVDYRVDEAGAAPPPHDAWILPLSLPYRLGVTEADLPTEPYLAARERAAGGRIGVAWRGQPGNSNDGFRSLPQAVARRLLDLPGAISLEPAATGARDFRDTADIIAGLDLVISIDTSVAHLAGAMGAPAWVLLARHALDWQWPRGERGFWYPSARLFCQETPGDWDAVVDRVVAELAAP